MKSRFKRHKQIIRASKKIKADIYYWYSLNDFLGATIFICFPQFDVDCHMYRAKVRKSLLEAKDQEIKRLIFE